MKKPQGPVSAEIILQKSRFLALVFPVNTPEEAREKLKELKKQYEDATHVVHTFLTGKANSLTTGYSDDGEPPGTAGRPVFDVVKGREATGIFVAVVRWFGGTKLGTGGLVKAYGDAAKAVLDLVAWDEDLDWEEFTLEVDYSLYEPTVRALKDRGGVVLAEDFAHSVKMKGKLLVQEKSGWENWVRDAARGAWKVRWDTKEA